MYKRIVVILLLVVLTGCNKIDVNTLNTRAKNLIDRGDYDGAISRLVSILDIAPNYPRIHYNLAIAYYRKKEYLKAIDALDNEIKIDPGFADAYYTLGTIYEELVQDVSAHVSGFSSTKLNPAVVEQTEGYYQKSIQNFKTYLQRTPNKDDIQEVKNHLTLLEGEYTDFKKKAKSAFKTEN